MLTSVVSILFRFRSPYNGRLLYTGMGEVLAEETAQRVREGSVAIVAYADETGGTSDPRVEAFRRGLQKYSSLRITTSEHIPADPNLNNGLPGCPPAKFLDILQRHSKAAAIIFFVELPDYDALNFSPETPSPKLIAIDTASPQLKRHYHGYFVTGKLTALVAPSNQEPTSSTEPKMPREWFDRSYQVYTAQNYESLPE